MRTITTLGAALLLWPGAPAMAQTGGFIVTLGTDTVHAERFTRTGDALEGTIVVHTPAVRVVKWTLKLAPDGMPARYDMATFTADGSAIRSNGMAGTITWAADSLTRATLKNGEMVTER